MELINTEQNRKTLYDYLIKQTIKEKNCTAEEAIKFTQYLMQKHINNLFGKDGLASWLGSKNIEFFCIYYLQDTFVPKPNNAARKLAPVHYEIWEELHKIFIEDKWDKEEFILPRGIAKTTVCDFALTVWCHCYKKSIYSLICGKTEQDSTEFIAETRHAFEENPYIIESFGSLIKIKDYTVNKLELELANGTKIQAISSTSSVRGKKFNGSRPSLIIADDYQGKSDVITEEARDKKYKTWIEDSGYAGDKAVYRNGVKIKAATKFIVLGTILHRDCFMSRIFNNREYEHIFRRVVNFDVDEYFNNGLWGQFKKIYFDDKIQDPKSEAKEFYYQHEAEMQYKTLWDDKYNCLDLAIDYYNNITSFKQEMMNDASKIGERWFKSIRTQSTEEIEEHEFKKTMLCCDPASSVTNKADYSAFAVGSEASNNFMYIRKGILIRVSFDDFCLKVIELLKNYPDITHVSIEKNLYMGADVSKIQELISRNKELCNRKIEFINTMQKKNKDEKISTIVDGTNNGQIIYNEEDKDFIEQIKDFCGQDFSLHDDAPDVVSQLTIDIKDIKVRKNIPVQDKPKGW